MSVIARRRFLVTVCSESLGIQQIGRDLECVWDVIKGMFEGVFGGVFGGVVEGVFRCDRTRLGTCLRATGRKFRPTEKFSKPLTNSL